MLESQTFLFCPPLPKYFGRYDYVCPEFRLFRYGNPTIILILVASDSKKNRLKWELVLGRYRVSFWEKVAYLVQKKLSFSWASWPIKKNSKNFGPILGPQEQFAQRFFSFYLLEQLVFFLFTLTPIGFVSNQTRPLIFKGGSLLALDKATKVTSSFNYSTGKRAAEVKTFFWFYPCRLDLNFCC